MLICRRFLYSNLSPYKTVLYCYNRMYGTFRNTKLFGRRADGRMKLNNVYTELNSPFLDDAFHKTHPPAFRYSILCGNFAVYEKEAKLMPEFQRAIHPKTAGTDFLVWSGCAVWGESCRWLIENEIEHIKKVHGKWIIC